MPALSRSLAAPSRLLATLIAGIVLVVGLAVATPAAAQNVPRAYAGIVVDAKTGQTLYEESPDALRYPASLTKVMTLYILFQELEAGRLQLDSRLTVSAHAAAAVPTKLYVRAGSTITVENAIRALVTLSANDVARVIAENIGGTESQFALRMTQTARALGMSRTTYRNASGLPDSAQVTTARDQATLARAVYLHFPSYYEYFQTRSFTYGSQTYGNHNPLLGQNGVDGIKTGYINASGYNLMTSSRANNSHIVVIGLGFNTTAARNSRMSELIRTYLPRARSGDYWREAMIDRPGLIGNGVMVAAAPTAVPLGALPPSRPLHLLPQIPAPGQPGAPILAAAASASAIAPTPAPAPENARPAETAEPADIPFNVVEDYPGATALQQANLVAAAGSNAAPNAENDPLGAWIAETLLLGPTSEEIGTLQPGQVLVPPAPISRPEGLLDYTATNSSAAVPVGGWIVQVGAAADEASAAALIADATGTVAPLGSLRSYVEPIERNGQTFYRARFAGFADRNQARAACDQLVAADIACLAVQG